MSIYYLGKMAKSKNIEDINKNYCLAVDGIGMIDRIVSCAFLFYRIPKEGEEFKALNEEGRRIIANYIEKTKSSLLPEASSTKVFYENLIDLLNDTHAFVMEKQKNYNLAVQEKTDTDNINKIPIQGENNTKDNSGVTMVLFVFVLVLAVFLIGSAILTSLPFTMFD
ncbi:MAG: hypothetical protein COZ66_01875 [Candidatus Huberarchaeum crystalense]|uniref:Uncharacterized protein n=1 Tax=Huberarchaeum crystalense TaxID=2014257 RepID=A0A2H9N2E7_HUBC1|nr:MAG: hypothetical protein COZ66_01875 [Candidatus Huberarchaeum crystalense]